MVEPQKQRREGGRGGVGRKSDKEEEMKSVAVCERNTLREREMVARSSSLCHELSWVSAAPFST